MDSIRHDWVFVLGMHRSGTSALTRMLNITGFYLAENLLQGQEGVNDDGFWEDADVVKVNEALLRELGFTWYDMFIDIPASSRLTEDTRQAMISTIDKYRVTVSPVAVKDPRLCRLLPFWSDVLADYADQFRIKCLLAIRNPYEVARSLERRDGLPLYISLIAWLDHVLDAEKNSRRYQRLHVNYDSLLNSPYDSACNILRSLNIDVDLDATGIKEKLNQEIRKQKRHFELGLIKEESTIGSLVSDVYSYLESNTIIDFGEFDSFKERFDNYINSNKSILNVTKDVLNKYFIRTNEIQRLGRLHTDALHELHKKDKEIDELNSRITKLGREHDKAIKTVQKRDDQLSRLNSEYEKLGHEHGYAISIVEQRDREIVELKEKLEVIEKEFQSVCDSFGYKLYEFFKKSN